MAQIPEYHTIHFYHDNDNASALTALVNGERYHIIADPKRLNDRSKGGKKIANKYRQLLNNLREAEADEGEEAAEGTAPLFVQEDEGEQSSSSDSGVDVSEPMDEDNDDHDDGPSGALKRWMLSPLKDTFSSKDTKANLLDGKTVQDWYLCTTHFYDLYVQDGKLLAKEDKSPSESLTKRTDALIPSMALPKYIRELKIPSFKASEVVVVRESSDPAPIHPALVRYHGDEYFLKVVDRNLHKPMKREISVMKRIEAEGLQHEIRVPLLRGMVHFTEKNGNRSPHAMGFLMDAIEDAKPLTHMLDADIPEQKRAKWAEESARMVDLLHQHGIIWGDAKGDNFMVDANDDLWIIDFGGSYTEGWVDPELNETEEGDDQGIRRLVNGLNDPENNTTQPGDAEAAEQQDGDKEEEQKQGQDDDEQEAQEADGDKADDRNASDSKDTRRNEDDRDEDEDMGDADAADVEETAEIRRMQVKKIESCADWEASYEESRSREPLLKTDIMDRERFVDMKGKSCLGWEESVMEPQPKQSKKRSADKEDRPTKQRKTAKDDTAGGENEPKYCYCNGPESGRMLACDGENCEKEWFHFDCVGLKEAPESKKWFCKECRDE